MWDFERVQTCPGCGNPPDEQLEHAERRRGHPLWFVRCRGCAMVYQSPRLTRDALRAYFNSETFLHDGVSGEAALTDQLGYYDYAAWEASYRATARIRLRKILSYQPQGGRLLEIGPATGVFLREAQRVGYDPVGLDVSERLAVEATCRTGVPVMVGAIEDWPRSPSLFDVIACFGGFSCWRDPLQALQNIRQALRPGGIFVCNVPDADHWLPRWQGRRYPEYNHASLTIVSQRTLAELFRRAGLRCVQNETERQSATLGRIVTYLRWPRAVRVLRALNFMDVALPVLVPGVRFVVAEAA